MTEKKQILLVDDDADLVETYRVVLEENGYKTCCAYNGRDGLDRALAEKPDLIVLDVMMATSSEGFDISRELRQKQQTKATPILMLTSVNTTVPFKFEADERWLPVDKFIEKPLAPDKLLKEVKQALG